MYLACICHYITAAYMYTILGCVIEIFGQHHQITNEFEQALHLHEASIYEFIYETHPGLVALKYTVTVFMISTSLEQTI